MSDRASSYRLIPVTIASADAQLSPQLVFPAGSNVIAVTALSVPSPYFGLGGDSTQGFLRLHVGEGADPVRINVQGMTWASQRNPATGVPAAETSGIFLSASAGCPDIVGVELYIELQAAS